MMAQDSKPIVLITGATGNIGRTLASSLAAEYQIVGLDLRDADLGFPVFEADFASDASIRFALHRFSDRFGTKIESVIHLVAYYDFTNEESPLYRALTVEGTRSLLRALQAFDVEQFIYASSMLVHRPCRPGERIDETQPIEPRWAYPRSKAAAEAVVHEERGRIPCVTLRLAGVYDEHTMVPTLARQVARIYERDLESFFYAGSTLVGQAMLHRDDMVEAFRLTVAARHRLPAETHLLIGEADAVGYDALQDEVGRLLHGVSDWPTVRVPKIVAAAGTWAQGRLESLVPDVIDRGEKPFIRPFMMGLADDHYALDVRRAREAIGWEPRRRLKEELPRIAAALKADPQRWYAANGIAAPDWITSTDADNSNPDALRRTYDAQRAAEYGETRWAHFVNIALGTWLVTQPVLVGVAEPALRWAEMVLGCALIVFALFALSWRATWARWTCAAIGTLVMAAPFVFWTENAAAYLSDTLVGALIFGFAVCLKPEPGTCALAALSGPEIPPGWTYNPSSWAQRVPIIATALIGLYVSRYLGAYQLGYLLTVWDPFFPGSPADPRNGTEEIVTSWVSKAWPFPDAAIGAYVYVLEIVTALVGSTRRWRTMPWLVILFGLMIAPLGVTSIVFIIIQPVLLDTWSVIALIGAAAILVQIPYSLDELIATVQFMHRRSRAGRNWIRVLFVGDTDDEATKHSQRSDEFARPPVQIVKDMLGGGVNLPWNLALAAVVALSLLFTRVTVGAADALADAHHVLGALALTVISLAAAEVARPVRYVNVLLGAGVMIVPWIYEASVTAILYSVAAGAALVALSIRRGRVAEQYGGWSRCIV